MSKPKLSSSDDLRNSGRSEVKCYDCGGSGHISTGCPTGKRRCLECRGIGHTKFECPNKTKRTEKSYTAQSDSESEDDDEDMVNMVAFVSDLEADAAGSKTDSEGEEDEVDPIEDYRTLYDSWIELSRDKLNLVREKLRLESEVKRLEEEVVDAIGASVIINTGKDEIAELKDLYEAEKRVSASLLKSLDDTNKKVQMLNLGTNKLDEILQSGRQDSSRSGLGYIKQDCGESSNSAKGAVLFVKKGTIQEEQSSLLFHSKVGKSLSENPSKKPVVRQVPKVKTTGHVRRKRFARLCGFCNKTGHIRRWCYAFKDQLKVLWSLKKCYLEPARFGCVWIAKDDLYTNTSVWKNLVEVNRRASVKSGYLSPLELVGNVAYTSQADDVESKWYFDSGCSRHMTGCDSVLDDFVRSEYGKVTFGGGHKGKIRGKGNLGKGDQPQLSNVFFVEGLQANLISVSQLCDEDLQVWFSKTECRAVDDEGKVMLSGIRSGNNCYMWKRQEVCLTAACSQIDLWHKRLGHLNTQALVKLVKTNAIRGIPNLSGSTDTVCSACNKGKQIKVQHKRSTEVVTSKVLELVHMDLMGPVQVESIGGKRYILVMVDDFSRYTWVRFMREKSDTITEFSILAVHLKNIRWSIGHIRSDRGGEFVNEGFQRFCEAHGIGHQFSAPRTPQQNGVVERKNRTLQEMARAMMHGKDVPTKFWAEAINTACYIINRVYVRPGTNTTPYEIWKGYAPNIYYFRVFGCTCYILNDKDQLGKFDARSDEGFLLGYSWNSKAYRVFNKRTRKVEESVNVVFDDNSRMEQVAEVEDLEENRTPPEECTQTDNGKSDQEGGTETTGPQVHRNHSPTDLIGNIDGGRITRGKKVNYREMIQFASFVSLVEPSNIKDALQDEFWTVACQEELNQFTRNDVWDLVKKPEHANVVDTKWIFKNKIDELGNVTRNKARLVAQGYSQLEGIDFDETFAPVARIESIRLLLGVACVLNIRLYQMDVKSAFLNGILEEEVYVAQPKGFEDPEFPEHVYKLKKALYGLKQAPRAWYERLTQFLENDGFVRGSVDKTLFLRQEGSDILIVQIYVDDMVFGSTNEMLVKKLVKTMTSEFEMSMMGELNYFLGLQICQTSDGITVTQSTYAQNMIKRFGMQTCKPSKTPMSTSVKLCKDEDGEAVDQKLYRSMIGSLLYLTATRPDLCYSVGVCARYQAAPRVSHMNAVKRIIKYIKGSVNFGLNYTKHSNSCLAGFCDADWAGCTDDRRSTSGGCFFLGNNLISWHSKKQNCVTLSTAEAEYIALGSCCTQLLWMQQMLADYGMHLSSLLVYCDNLSAINISKNPVQHSRTKHIDIRHHFVRDLVDRNVISLSHVTSENQLADIFTKSLDLNTFTSLQKSLGICSN